MEPFRAFVADKLPDEQRTSGFVMQSFFIGIGAAIANSLPYILRHCGVIGNASNGVPNSVQYAFKLGALVFLAAVAWTVLTSKEYPPENMEEFLAARKRRSGFRLKPVLLLVGAISGVVAGAARGALVDHQLTAWHLAAGGVIGAAIGAVLSGAYISTALAEMPRTMKQLAVVQFFTWLGLFCMWMFFSLATAQQVFGAVDPKSPEFDEGTAFGGQTFMWYSIVCFAVAFLLPMLARATSRQWVHALALTAGGLSLLSTGFIHDRVLWQFTMVGVGIAWASILSMPYALLSGSLPAERMGVYMGIFNFFIVIPEIVASVALEPIVKNLFHNDPVKVVMMGGGSMLVAALMVMRVRETRVTP
jgi:maltose/moltooligosaccharide transporter